MLEDSFRLSVTKRQVLFLLVFRCHFHSIILFRNPAGNYFDDNFLLTLNHIPDMHKWANKKPSKQSSIIIFIITICHFTHCYAIENFIICAGRCQKLGLLLFFLVLLNMDQLAELPGIPQVIYKEMLTKKKPGTNCFILTIL